MHSFIVLNIAQDNLLFNSKWHFFFFTLSRVCLHGFILQQPKHFFVNLSNWRLHFFNDDSVHLIGTCKRITIGVERNVTVSNAETDSNVASSNPTTVAFYVIRSVNVNISALVKGTVNWSWVAALCIVKRKEPSLAAACATCYPKITHINHSKV